MDYAAVGQGNTIGILKDNVPAALFAVVGNMALVDIVEYSLMKITYIIVIGLITLTENLVADDLFPRSLINCLIENQLDRVNDILVETLQVEGFQLFTVLLNGFLDVLCKIFFADETKCPHYDNPSNAIFICFAIS